MRVEPSILDNPVAIIVVIACSVGVVIGAVIIATEVLGPLFRIYSERMRGRSDLAYWRHGRAAEIAQAKAQRQVDIIEADTELKTAWVQTKADFIRSAPDYVVPVLLAFTAVIGISLLFPEDK